MIGVQSKQNCHCMVQFPVSRKKCYNIFICIIPPPLLFLKIILFPQYIKNHCNKLKICNSFIFATWWCKPLIFKFIEQNSYQRSMPSIDWKIWVFDNNSVLLNFIIGSELFEYSTIRRPRKHLFDYTGHLCKELKRLFYLVKIHSFLFKFEYLKGVLAKN